MTREEADAPGKALLRLGDETRLPDSRLAGDRDDRALSLEQPVEGLAQRRQLLLASDQRRLDARTRLVVDADDAERADGLAPPLQLELAELLELEGLVDLARRRLPHDEVAERLQPCRHVDRVTERVVENVRGRVTARERPPGRC